MPQDIAKYGAILKKKSQDFKYGKDSGHGQIRKSLNFWVSKLKVRGSSHLV